MPLDQSLFPVLTPAKVEFEAATRPTGFGEYLGAKAQQGFDYSIAGRITERMTTPSPALGPLPAGNTPEQNADMGFKPGRRLTEDEWKKLRLDRPGLAFSGGGTVEYETARTRAYDERRYRDSLVERYQGGLLGQAAGFAAGLVGSIPSPENFVPFVGEGVRAAMVTRMGLIGGRAAAGALDATIGTVIADAGALPDLANRGEDVGAADFALDVALGAVIGSAFGAGGGVLQLRAEARAKRELLAQAARAVRIDGLERQADALEVAMRAVADDQPVDVGPVVADALPKVQERAARMEPVDAVERPSQALPPLQFTDEVVGSTGRQINRSITAVRDGTVVGRVELAMFGGEMQIQMVEVAENARRQGIGRELLTKAQQIADTEGVDLVSSLRTEDGQALFEDMARRGIRKPSKADLAAEAGLADIQARADGLAEQIARETGEPAGEITQAVRAIVQNPNDAADAWARLMPLQDRTTVDYNDLNDLYYELENAPRPSEDLATLRRLAAEGPIKPPVPPSTAPDIATRAVTPEPHPSVVEAQASVTRAPPKTGLEEAQRLAADMALDDPPELADIAVMKRDGLLTAADEASLERANEVVKEADGWATAYETLSTCVLRYGS